MSRALYLLTSAPDTSLIQRRQRLGGSFKPIAKSSQTSSFEGSELI
ncbi:MAG: hypothetical protein KI793_08365 [Rivularia sp. (in: Bacteria)]|nr:hypothetical protein [Rivularia sp. MS3]